MADRLSVLSRYLKEQPEFECALGTIRINPSDILGQGGNGIVYGANLEDSSVAVKFLTADNPSKLRRFKAEYINIGIIKDSLKNKILNYSVIYIPKKYKILLDTHRFTCYT
jgi:serine/threonine-protein kinase